MRDVWACMQLQSAVNSERNVLCATVYRQNDDDYPYPYPYIRI